MTARNLKYALLIVAAFGAMVAAELLRPTPIDWRRSYEADDTRPYGSRILFEQLPALFPAMPVTPVPRPPFLALQEADEEEAGTRHTARTYLFITETFAPDPAETAALLDFVEAGNTIFVAALGYEGALADTFRLATGTVMMLPEMPFDLKLDDDTLTVNFVTESLRTEAGYALQGEAGAPYLARFDTVRAAVLGRNSRDEVNLVRFRRGAGSLFVSTLPLAFTNVHMLYGEQAGYAYRALSYLPVQPVWWDAHYKPLRAAAGSPLRVILGDPSLRWAYYVLVAALVLFVVFEGRRRERAIPVVEPLQNTTVAFVETVGRLYHERGDHTDLAGKKITFLLDDLRTRLNLSVRELGDVLPAQVAERSGVPVADVEALFEQIRATQQAPVTEAALVALNHQIESFYARSQR